MGLSDVAQQAIHAATGVPRLSAAALRAGLGPAGALEVLRISQASLQAAATHGRGEPGRTNAVRHFLWQAVLTARFGVEAARAIAAAQEQGTPNHRDSRVDEHNNEEGQQYGLAHAEELRAGPPAAAVASLVPVALAKWESDDLVWIRRR
ncbi:hypothetical protein [Nocardioides sp. SYSU D00065]|uniref:DUF6973 domain-containing protein n=1 Tax=Nocardioides sp. SYSU D00065 TaxID=2817378 RepID=UPI001B33E8D7|nr:hypothetical protein [Nocardioides sp. SYSU D00065]